MVFKSTANVWTRTLIEECVRNGLRTFAVAPGSRSTPLVMALAARSDVEIHTHFDERALAFWALGVAKASGKPAPLITTSGTAVANLLPAVVEASQSGVPMLLLTADRPPEQLDTGANQTIQQADIFGNYSRFSHTFPCPTPDVPFSYLLGTMSYAIHCSQWPSPGPVHLNCMFRDPLYIGSEDASEDCSIPELDLYMAGDAPYTHYTIPEFGGDLNVSALCKERLSAATRGLIVIGDLSYGDECRDKDAILDLAATLNWPVIADITSGCRFIDHPMQIPFSDLLLRCGTTLDPDCVLYFGGRMVSTRLLDCIKSAYLIQIKTSPLRVDPIHAVDSCSLTTVSTATAHLQSLKSILPSQLVEPLKNRATTMARLIEQTFQKETVLTEPYVAWRLSKTVEGPLMISNSLPIRLMDQFSVLGANNSVTVFANRGASGIDGILSTACGIAAAKRCPVYLLIGDLALLYDMNALLMVSKSKYPIYILCLNNNGGGIFRQLDVSASPLCEDYVVMPQSVSLEGLAEMAGIQYKEADRKTSFDELLENVATTCLMNIYVDSKVTTQCYSDLEGQLCLSKDKTVV